MKISDQQKRAQQFLKFEIDNNLFDLTDSNGVYIWDIVRHSIGEHIIWDYTLATKGVEDRSVLNKLKILLHLLKVSIYFLNNKKYKTLSVVCSRNKLDGEAFDQNQHDALNLLNKKDIIFLETTKSLSTVYKNSYRLNYMQRAFGLLKQNDYIYYDFKYIIKVLKNHFPQLDISDENLNFNLKHFYEERDFYRFFLKKHSIQQIFLTQKGAMRGLLHAAKELNIKTFEFQHGIVNEKHFSYSYPKGVNLDDKSYQPTYMLRFSDFWFNDFYAPFEKITIGNNYFRPTIDAKSRNKKALVVISSYLISQKLSDFLMNCLDDIKDWEVYYKLHPNEFKAISYFTEKFKKFKNLKVITDQYSVTDLVEICSVMLTIQSTSIYEGLQGGCNIIIVDSGEYNEIENDNVYHITESTELASVLNKDLNPSNHYSFFEQFNATELTKHLAE